MAAPEVAQRLSTLLQELEARGYSCGDLNYRRLWLHAVEGRFPARQINGRWHFLPDDVPAIAAAYGLRRTSAEVSTV